MKTIPKQAINDLIKEFRAEIKENKLEKKLSVKEENYSNAQHLDSVNECLEYVIDRLIYL